MPIECTRCSGPTMAETVIKLRRGVLGFRETRWQGAYCAACGVSVTVQDPPAVGLAIAHRRTTPGGYLLTWLRGAPTRSRVAA